MRCTRWHARLNLVIRVKDEGCLPWAEDGLVDHDGAPGAVLHAGGAVGEARQGEAADRDVGVEAAELDDGKDTDSPPRMESLAMSCVICSRRVSLLVALLLGVVQFWGHLWWWGYL